MQIVNRGIMFVTICLGSEGGKMGSPDEWARSLGEEIQSKERVDRDIARTVAMRREIETEKMPLKWEEVIAAFQSCCTAYNEQLKPKRALGLHRSGSHEFMVRPDSLPEIITAKYDPRTKFIEIRSSVKNETFFPSANLTGSGEVDLVSLGTKKAKHPVAIAQDAIRECLIAP